jgi:phosphotransferase system  glucose/maltose/N-acetylglucosamine-specific IIC component
MLFKPMDWLGYLMFIPAIGLTGGALSTYWDNLFGFDNYWFAGFLVGIAAFPLYWSGVHWYLIIARALLLAVLWGGWSAAIKKDTWEEYGRGGFTALTMALLLL